MFATFLSDPQVTQCAYNVTLIRVRTTIVPVEKQLVLHILSVCLHPGFPGCNAHAPYYIVICSLRCCTTFLLIIGQTARFSGKTFIEHEICVLMFYTAFIRNVSHSKNNSLRCYHEYTYVFL